MVHPNVDWPADVGAGSSRRRCHDRLPGAVKSAYSQCTTRVLKRTRKRPDQKAYHRRTSRPLPGRPFMQRTFLASLTIALAAVSAPVAVQAQGQQPTFATTKVTDNVYYFRYQGHQPMFIVTPAGVIATDPIS